MIITSNDLAIQRCAEHEGMGCTGLNNSAQPCQVCSPSKKMTARLLSLFLVFLEPFT